MRALSGAQNGSAQLNAACVNCTGWADALLRMKICSTPSTPETYANDFPSRDHAGDPWKPPSVTNGLKCADGDGLSANDHAVTVAIARAAAATRPIISARRRGFGAAVTARL